MSLKLTSQDIEGVHDQLGRMVGPDIGLAVSGGGDSQALAALVADWAGPKGKRLHAVTVDHGLRAGSAAEARAVSSFCREFGISHETLKWSGWDGRGNLQDAARRARFDLIGAWARARGIRAVATGHTLDDQAETVLMRLARGSGVDGLAGMAASREHAGVTWHRPLLAARRAGLRDYLLAEGIPWVDDPSNNDDRFDRVKARRALALLAPLGVDATGLAQTADRMARAREALDVQTQDLALRAARTDHGDVVLDWTLLRSAPEEISNRLLISAMAWVSGAQYRPRADALARARAAMDTGQTHVLQGCHLSAAGHERRVTRELASVADTVSPPDAPWDHRWQLSGPAEPGLEVRALGENGIRDCPHWRDTGLPRVSLIATPSIWQGSRLLAAPIAGFNAGWTATLVNRDISLIQAIITH